MNQFEKMRLNVKSPLWKNTKIINNWEKQFKKEFGMKNSSYVKFEQNPYFKDLKEALYFGSEEEVANTYFAAHNQLLNDLEEIPGATYSWRYKQAHKRIMKSISSMNPINLSVSSPRGVTISKKSAFLKWVKKNFGKEGYNKAISSEKEYNYLVRKFKKIISKAKWHKAKSVYSSLDIR